MEKIESFKVNHFNLKTGLYVSRKDRHGKTVITTLDIRVTRPHIEPVMDMPAIHTIEHLGATYLRTCEIAKDVVYFGPMGCRTGFYLLLFGDWSAEQALHYVQELCEYVILYEGEIPGESPAECGNYLEHNLEIAKYYLFEYLERMKKECNLVYPQ